MSDLADLKKAIQERWSSSTAPREKARRYVDKFGGRQRRGRAIWAMVKGNHGDYKVSIRIEGEQLEAACSCYIGKYGLCHHVEALAYTFMKKPDSFSLMPTLSPQQVTNLDSLRIYLNGITLDELIKQLKEKGITQKALAETIGMSSRHLSLVKGAERRNHIYHELGATKLACVWVLTHLAEKG